MKRLIAALLGLCLAVVPAFATDWQYIGGPGGGGPVTSIAANGSTIWAGTDLGGLFKSTDDGATFLPQNLPFPTVHIAMVWVSPTDASHVLVGTDANSMWKTTNGGTSWAKSTGMTSNCYPTTVQNIGTGSNLLATTQTASDNDDSTTIWRSTDGGSSWSRAGGMLGPVFVVKAVRDQNDANYMYWISGRSASSSTSDAASRLYRTTSASSSTFSVEVAGPATADSNKVLDFAAGPNGVTCQYLTAGNQAALNSAGKVYSGTGGGINWTDRTPSGGGVTFKGAAVNFTFYNGGNVLVAQNLDGNSAGETWKLTPCGTSFTLEDTTRASWGRGYEQVFDRRYTKSEYGRARTVTAIGGSRLVWTSSRTSISLDHGSTFNPLDTKLESGGWKSTGLDGAVCQALLHYNGRTYAGFNDVGFFYSDDDEHWNEQNDSTGTVGWDGHGGECNLIFKDSDNKIWWTNSDTIYNSSSGDQKLALYYATDVTSTHNVASGLPDSAFISDMVEDPVNHYLYVCADGAVYKSTSLSSPSFSKISPSGRRDLMRVEAYDATIYAGGDSGLVRSTDGGSNWSNNLAVGIFKAQTANCGSNTYGTCYREIWRGIQDLYLDYPRLYATVYAGADTTNIGEGFWSCHAGTNDITEVSGWTQHQADFCARKIGFDVNQDLSFTSGRRFTNGGNTGGSTGYHCYDVDGSTWDTHNDALPVANTSGGAGNYINATAYFLMNNAAAADTFAYISILGNGIWKDAAFCRAQPGGGGGPCEPDCEEDRPGGFNGAIKRPVFQAYLGQRIPNLYDLHGRKVDMVRNRGVYFQKFYNSDGTLRTKRKVVVLK